MSPSSIKSPTLPLFTKRKCPLVRKCGLTLPVTETRSDDLLLRPPSSKSPTGTTVILLLVTEEERSSGGLSLSVQLPLSTDDLSYPPPRFMYRSRRIDFADMDALLVTRGLVASDCEDGGRAVVELLYRLNRFSVGSFLAFGLSVTPATSPVCRDMRIIIAGD